MEVQLKRLELARPAPVIERPEIEPNYVLEHPARGVAADWVEVTIPADQAAELRGPGRPARAIVFRSTNGQTWPAVWHRPKGRQGWSVRTIASFAERIVQGDFRAHEAAPAIAEFAMHPSVASIPHPEPKGLELQSIEVVHESPAERVERFSYANDAGEIVVIWRRRRWQHPVVDYGVRWGSRNPKRIFADDVVFPGAEHVHVHPAFRFDAIGTTDDRLWSVYPLDWGTAPTIWVRATYPAQGDENELATQLRELAHLAWPVGMATHYRQSDGTGSQRWLTLGVMPSASKIHAQVWADDCESLVRPDAPKGMFEPRPGAQAKRSNQAGTQRFGAAFGGLAMQLTPLRAYTALRICAGDEELRPVHWYEQDGKIVEAVNHPQLRTHNRALDWRNSKDKLDLAAAPPRIAPSTDRTADDEQHTDDLAKSALEALWDDYPLEETTAHVVEIQACDTQMHQGRGNSAARGIGRPMLAVSNAAWLFAGTPTGALAQAIVDLTVPALAETWEGRAVMALDPTRPVKPVSTLTGNSSWALTDPRTGHPMRAAAPYEHSTVVVGLLAAAQVASADKAALALQLALQIDLTVMTWAYLQDDEVLWPFIVGVLQGHEDGLALPEAWCRPGTPEFASTHVPGGSWTDWTAAAAFALPYLLEAIPHAVVSPELLDRAARVRADYEGQQDQLAERFTAVPVSLDQAPIASLPMGTA